MQLEKTNTYALVSLFGGIASFTIAPCIGAILAIIFGHMARTQIATTGEEGRDLATIGMVLGYVHVGLTAIFLLVIAAIFGLGLGTAVLAHH